MSNVSRGQLYGLDKELAEKRAAKLDLGKLKEAAEWLTELTGHEVPSTLEGMQSTLQNGYILALAVNAISPGAVKGVKETKAPFIAMQLITSTVEAAKKLGVPDCDTFRATDLFEYQSASSNFLQIIDFIHSLGRVAQRQPGYSGPRLGAKLAEARKTEFTDEQVQKGKMVVPKLTGGLVVPQEQTQHVEGAATGYRF